MEQRTARTSPEEADKESKIRTRFPITIALLALQALSGRRNEHCDLGRCEKAVTDLETAGRAAAQRKFDTSLGVLRAPSRIKSS